MEVIQSAHQKEVEALLSNIAALEKRITVLCFQNQSKSGEEDSDNGVVQSLCPKAERTLIADVEQPPSARQVESSPTLDQERSGSPRHGGDDDCVMCESSRRKRRPRNLVPKSKTLSSRTRITSTWVP